MIEYVQNVFILILSVVYPAYKSIRVVRKQESAELKLKLIKYW